jgi:hypothetical protein
MRFLPIRSPDDGAIKQCPALRKGIRITQKSLPAYHIHTHTYNIHGGSEFYIRGVHLFLTEFLILLVGSVQNRAYAFACPPATKSQWDRFSPRRVLFCQHDVKIIPNRLPRHLDVKRTAGECVCECLEQADSFTTAY